MTEVEKLELAMKEEGFRLLGVSLGDEARKMSPKERAEAVAGEINRVHEHMKNPVNALIARVEGQIFTMEDTIFCKENRTSAVHGGKIPLTEKERWAIDRDKEIVAMLKECVDMIEMLRIQS